ncbi:MAG: hypothetical protein WC530_07920 [Candidatus Omnitrophota bacterium]
MQAMKGKGNDGKSPITIAPPSAITASIDTTIAMRGLYCTLMFRMNALDGVGPTAPAAQVAALLKAFQFIELKLNTQEGERVLIPSSTRFYEYVSNMQRLLADYGLQAGRGTGAPGVNFNSFGRYPWSSLTTLVSSSAPGTDYDVVIPFYIPFAIPGGDSWEMDIAAFIPKASDLGMTLTITPHPAFCATTPSVSVAIDHPAPGGDVKYTVSGYGGVGSPYLHIYPDQIINATSGKDIGGFYPVVESKRLVLEAGADAKQTLNNWSRDGKFRAVMFNAERLTTAAGIENAEGIQGYGATGIPLTLRDWELFANSISIRKENLLCVGAHRNGIVTPLETTTHHNELSPIIIDFMRGQSFYGLPSWSDLPAQAQLDMEFTNLVAPTAGYKEVYSVMTLRYLPR